LRDLGSVCILVHIFSLDIDQTLYTYIMICICSVAFPYEIAVCSSYCWPAYLVSTHTSH